MPDSQALRAKRSRLHRQGDHALCHRDRCDSVRFGKPELVPPVGESGLAEAYRGALEDAGRLATPEGAQVMHLAALLAAGQHAASGAAALSRELRAAMEVALRGAPRKADAVDELETRRNRKLSGA